MVDAGGLSVEGVSAFPRSSAHRYTQVLGVRLFGMDAEIQRPRMANCGIRQMPLYPRTGNYDLASCLNQALAQPTGYRPWPGLAHHIHVVRASPRASRVQIRSRRICRHPCRNDGFFGLPGLVYNGEHWSERNDHCPGIASYALLLAIR